MSTEINIIGIGGLPRSGKDSLADEFIKAGYYGVSFGDIVREYARERHRDKPDPISVVNMTETSNWLRETRGPDVILQEALRQYEAKLAAGEEYKGLVLYSVRAPVEVDFILDHGGELIWVEAADAVRHARAQKHLRKGEIEEPLEQFKAQEALQWRPQPGIPKEVQMDISYVRQKATMELVNNGDDFEAFLTQARELIKRLWTKKDS
jgi:dephospho-CoA kinase